MASLSLVIPSYNSEAHIERALANLIHYPDDLEVIIVNDGSKDRTAEIAQAYVDRYPHFQLINQENAGHGGAINAGLKRASAPYFKVLDSDDRLDREGLESIVQVLKQKPFINEECDLLICNFYFEVYRGQRAFLAKQMEDGAYYRRKLKSYARHFQSQTLLRWEEANYKHGQLFLMHALIFRRKCLLDMGLELPEHVCYEDNLLVYLPQRHIRNFYYLDLPLYRYFIGRGEQTISFPSLMKNRHSQWLVTERLFADVCDETTLAPALADYRRDHAARMLFMSRLIALMREDPKAELDAFELKLRNLHCQLYDSIQDDWRLVLLRRLDRFGPKFTARSLRFLYRVFDF